MVLTLQCPFSQGVQAETWGVSYGSTAGAEAALVGVSLDRSQCVKGH